MWINSEEMEKSPSSGHQLIIKELPRIVGGIILGIGSLFSLLTIFQIDVIWSGSLSSGPVGGFINCWNQFARLMGREHYILIDVYEGGEGNGLFILVLGVVMILIAYMTLRISPILSAILYGLPIMAISVLWDFHPAFYAVILMAFGIILPLIKWDLPEGEMRQNMKPTLKRLGVLAGVATLVLLSFLIPLIQKQLTNISLIETGKTFRADKWDEINYTDEPELTVTMEKPESLYLRGFVGESFAAEGWKSLPVEKIYENRDREYWLGKEGFDALSQLTKVDSLVDEESKETHGMNISVEGKKSKHAYVPYELAAGEIEGTKNWGNSFFTFDSFRAGRSYDYSVTENKTGRWTDLAGELFTAELSEDVEEYRRLESYYNRDMYSRYTYLDDGTITTLSENVGSRGNQEKGHVDYKTAIAKVKDFMDGEIAYSETAGEDSNKSLKELFESHSGTDEDYATVATLMFRYYGIPARYVKGALVTLEDEKAMEPGRPYKLDGDKNHHAWTEIYVDAVGWVPIEICSGYYDVMKEADLSRGLDNDSTAAPFDQAENNPLQDPLGSNEKEEGRKIPWKLLLLIIAGGILLAILTYLAVKLIRKVVEGKNLKKTFHQEDVRKGVCAVYGYMQRKNIPCEAEAEAIAMRGAYSLQPVTEVDRSHMLRALEAGKEALKEKRKRR